MMHPEQQTEQKKERTLLQVKLSEDAWNLVDDIKEIRSKRLEPTTNKSIVVDALKKMHSEITEL